MLTAKFYAKKVLRYVRSRIIESKCQALMRQPQKSLLEGAVLISQWGQIDQQHLTSLKDVGEILDKMSQRVMGLLGENKIIFDAENPRIVRKVLNCINQVLYGDVMGFRGNTEEFHENWYIDKVNTIIFFCESTTYLSGWFALGTRNEQG